MPQTLPKSILPATLLQNPKLCLEVAFHRPKVFLNKLDYWFQARYSQDVDPNQDIHMMLPPSKVFTRCCPQSRYSQDVAPKQDIYMMLPPSKILTRCCLQSRYSQDVAPKQDIYKIFPSIKVFTKKTFGSPQVVTTWKCWMWISQIVVGFSKIFPPRSMFWKTYMKDELLNWFEKYFFLHKNNHLESKVSQGVEQDQGCGLVWRVIININV